MTACTIERSMPATSVAPFSCPARQSDLIYVAGRLSYRNWTGQDGQQRHSTEIVASDVVLLDRRPSGEIPDASDAELNSGDDQTF